jgi:hypothetical protein
MFLEQIDLPDVGSEDTSRRWRLDQMIGGHIYQIRNVQTGKCLTSAGGVSTDKQRDGSSVQLRR